jgi:hypothetical protein
VVQQQNKTLNFYTKYQPANNVSFFLVMHRVTNHPPVSAGTMKTVPAVAMRHWQTGTIIKNGKIPKDERITIPESQNAFRVQQLPSQIPRMLIAMMGRATIEQPPVIVLDPFHGTGSTAIAAFQLNCPFVGNDFDPAAKGLTTETLNALLVYDADEDGVRTHSQRDARNPTYHTG